MGRNKSYIDLSVFSCSLSQFLSLVFSSCSEVNCLHKSSLVQKCLLSLAFWIYTLFCFILWNYSSAFAFWTLECFCQLRIVFWSPLLSVYFWSPFCLNLYQILLHLNISWVHLCLGSPAPSGSRFESLTLIPLIWVHISALTLTSWFCLLKIVKVIFDNIRNSLNKRAIKTFKFSKLYKMFDICISACS